MRNIFWAGDSTVQFNDISTYPQTGIGQVMNLYLDDSVGIVNCAKNGRSTKSFIDEGRLKAISDNIKEGDFLFIQFGHNDEKDTDVTRYTNPEIDYYNNLCIFVKETLRNNAYPVLITPLERRTYINEHALDEGKHFPYVCSMKRVASDLNVPLIDLYSMSRDALEKAGATATQRWYMHIPAGIYPYKPEGLLTDNTHLRYEGAVIFAGMIAFGLKNLGGLYEQLVNPEWDGKINLFCLNSL